MDVVNMYVHATDVAEQYVVLRGQYLHLFSRHRNTYLKIPAHWGAALMSLRTTVSRLCACIFLKKYLHIPTTVCVWARSAQIRRSQPAFIMIMIMKLVRVMKIPAHTCGQILELDNLQ
jgi:hypothetical protein